MASSSPASIDLSRLAHDKAADAAGILSASINDGAPAADAADRLDRLYRAQKPDDVEDFLWSLWNLFIAVVKLVPADDARQQLLVDVVVDLTRKPGHKVKLWNQETDVWSELPMLGPCMRDAWNLRPKLNGSDGEGGDIGQWISLNSFAARLFSLKKQDWVNFAIWELRAALEERLPDKSPAAARDAGLETACEWIVRAGDELHRQSCEDKKLEDFQKAALAPGKLLKQELGDGASSGLGRERWTFWRQRLELLGAEANTDELKARAQMAVKKMKELEG